VSWFLWSAADPQHAAYDLVKQDLGLLRAFIIENKEEGMTYNRVGVWASYQRKLLEMPMFQKVRAAHPELGDPLQRMSMAIPSNTVWGHICSRIMLVA
jgi:hypothetical protein